ncbi:glycosyltransferase family 10 [Synechococcus sp. AH-736-G20]|nr:glycosyltransferase family 10 [Synechococcus sp. AH-736-G20]
MANILYRQIPGRSNRWGDCEFFVNDDTDACDWWFICHITAIKEELTAICDPDHVVFISMEPVDWGCKPFYKQFSTIVGCDERILHPNQIRKNIHTWWSGINVGFENGHIFYPSVNHDYDSFFKLSLPSKVERISVVTSTNRRWAGHLSRLHFIDYLKASSVSSRVDFYGGGSNPILDKFDAIAPYCSHIVLENSQKPDYWSEKLADAFLGLSFPIYYGCTNLNSYFPSDSFLEIDIEKPGKAIDLILSCLEPGFYESRLPALLEARELILNKYNFFSEIASLCISKNAQRRRQVRIRPNSYYQKRDRRNPRALLSRLKNKLLPLI